MSGVIVVGAGIVGSSVAYHLARRGVAVTLLDREPAPASGVTGGSFAWVGGRGDGGSPGATELRAYVLADHRRLEAELPGHSVRWVGSLSWSDAASSGGERLWPGQFRVGREEIAALEPALVAPPETAVHTPSDGGVDPVAMTRALVDAARAHGARYLPNAPVSALRVVGERVEGVWAPTGYHAADAVVLAAGTEVPRLCAPLLPHLPVAVSPAQLVRLSAPPGLVRTILDSPGMEVREVREGELLLPLAVPPGAFPPSSARRAADEALARVRTLFRGGAECRLLDQRVSGRPMPADGPLVGPVTRDRSLWVTVTHAAITLAPTVGRLVADALVTGRVAPELRRCRPRG
ncbi:Glycine/D-amino acid oxidase [Streptomyces zhaozhouensis]|uniref:Glycine/D-amino acid oxidase n=1 Tax=Streptomyces zhaozhouensis TaxID=1300267 RepID=A0A286E3N4_9ACTN|nr:FAD-dependent oxidoreductase [Streptomyces zhaozhouensis]SOD65484.1 Glycine/D-amino acid oxidase [Streptomyces zhaozhouensis]